MPFSPASSVQRAFGARRDLDLDFAHEDRPALVTTVLAAACDEADAEDLWGATLGARIGALAALVARTEHAQSLPLALRCTACGATIEAELPISALVELGEAATAAPTAVACDGVTLLVRRPTGADQRQWRRVRFRSRDEAVQAMLAALVVSADVQPLSAAVAPSVAAALAEIDPLVAFRVDCACPECGTANSLPVDLEAVLLRRLASRQRALEHEVHALASRYGWSEDQIFAVPPGRRARYLAMIEADALR